MKASNAIYLLADKCMNEIQRAVDLADSVGVGMKEFIPIEQIRESDCDIGIGAEKQLPYELHENIEANQDRTSFLIHTSGSTGHPKTVARVHLS